MKKIFENTLKRTTQEVSSIILKIGEAATENCCLVFQYEPEIPKELQK